MCGNHEKSISALFMESESGHFHPESSVPRPAHESRPTELSEHLQTA